VTVIGNNAFQNCTTVIYSQAAAKPDGWSNNWNSSGCLVYWGINGSNFAEADGAQYLQQGATATLVRYVGNAAAFTIPQTVTIGGVSRNVTAIGDQAFYNRTNLSNIIIPAGVTSIGDIAFYNCRNLTNVTIPAGVTTIGAGAFNYCSGLTSVIIPSSVTAIGNFAFYNCNNLIIYAQAAAKPDGWSSSWNYSNRLVYWGIGSSEFIEVDGAQYVLQGTTATLVKYTGGADTFTIPQTVTIGGVSRNVTAIGAQAFINRGSLLGVTIPADVTSIGDNAFNNCNALTGVTFGEGSQLEAIGISAFYNCGNLSSIAIPASVTSIGDNAFYNCNALTGVTFEAGSQLKAIGNYAFESCVNLLSITIPSGVTAMGNYAFSGWSSGQMIFIQGLTGRLAGWSNSWNSSCYAQIYWNAGEKTTYGFVPNGGSAVASITDYVISARPVTTREGWYFAGWFDNEALDGDPVAFPYYRPDGTKTTLYAKWSLTPVTDGKTFDTAHNLFVGSVQVVFTSSQNVMYYTFTPAETRSYTIYSTNYSSGDPYVVLYNAAKSQIAYDDDGGSGWNFRLTMPLTAGQAYYYVVYCGYSATMTMVLE